MLTTDDILISKVYACQSPENIIIVLSSSNNIEHLVLVWNLIENAEVRNFSTRGDYYIIYGPSSKTGYLLSGTKYINLDNCIPNYFFDFDFRAFNLPNPNGYKMNKQEELVLHKGNLIMKTLYMESIALDRYLSGIDRVDDGQISYTNLKFQIEGNTCLHLYALEYEELNNILEYLDENKKEYLNAILMKNHMGLSPLDLTIDNDSPKCTDLLLTFLSKLSEANYSEQISKKFSSLFQMDIKSFQNYLDSCYFQTVQMQNTKFLSLRDGSREIMVAHDSCLLDKNFMEKHTTFGLSSIAIRERERQLKEGETKHDAMERKLQQEMKKKKEQEKSKLGKSIRSGKSGRSRKATSSKGFSKSMRPVSPNDVVLEQNNTPMQYPSFSYGSSGVSEYADKSEFSDISEGSDYYSSYYSSSEEEASPRSGTSQLDIKQLAQLNKDRQKAIEKKMVRKERLRKIKEQEKKEREEREKQYQAMREAHILKIQEEREKQKEAQRTGLKRYNIRAIEFDWLFDEETGRNFLDDLTRTKSLDIFSIKLISQIILFLWQYYRSAIFLQVWLPFLVYFVVFLLYATWTHLAEVNATENLESWKTLNIVFICIIIAMIVYNILFELRKLIFYKQRYFQAYWNFVNIASIVLNTIVVISDLNDVSEKAVNPFLAFAVLFMWLRLVYFGRMFFSTAWMVRMFFSVTKEIRYFLIIFGISILAFASAYEVLTRKLGSVVSKDSFFDTLVYTYSSSLGEFDVDGFADNPNVWLLYFIWLSSTFFLLIVLLNLLIALISDIFDKVHENITNNLMKELVYFMVESEFLINRTKIFKKYKYMIIITKVTGHSEEFDPDSRLSIIRHNMDLQVKLQNKFVNEMTNQLEKQTKEKIRHKADILESSANKSIFTLTERVEETENTFNKYKGVFDQLMKLKDDK